MFSFFGANSNGANATNCDFAYYTAGGHTLTYQVFTTKGKYWVKVLNALGYAVPQGVDNSTTSTWYTSVGVQKFSAFPLLAFFKLYNDYMSQSKE